jgi:hypothetical protein
LWIPRFPRHWFLILSHCSWGAHCVTSILEALADLSPGMRCVTLVSWQPRMCSGGAICRTEVCPLLLLLERHLSGGLTGLRCCSSLGLAGNPVYPYCLDSVPCHLLWSTATNLFLTGIPASRPSLKIYSLHPKWLLTNEKEIA